MTQRTHFSETFKRIRENLHFVLVQPESPGNVGSVARALKTSGFHQLTLVAPCELDTPEVRMLAHRSIDIVRQATVVQSFDEAIADKRLVISTSMRSRHFKFPYFTPAEISEKILPVAFEQPVAIVFGPERTGLTNEQILKCQLHSTIPTATQNPSLNLSQAVMLYAHTFFEKMNQVDNTYSYELASQHELQKFYEHLDDALRLVNFVPRDGIDNFITRIRRLIGRSMAEHRDVRLLHKLLQIFETRIHDLETDSSSSSKREIH